MTKNPAAAPADLTDRVADLDQRFTTEYTAALAAEIAAAVNINRLALAQTCLDADLPENAVVDLVDWSDEPNGDATYDLDLTEAYILNGDHLDDLGGRGAVAAGRYNTDGSDAGTDWDIFKPDNAPDAEYIEVAKVYAWLRAQA